MNKEILKFIKLLSKNDNKTLSQKTLKASEEVGELAKVVLPYENAEGTLHRFVDKNKILEEVVDNILVQLSIAYDIDMTDDDIESMMHEKVAKWQSIQTKESKLPDTIPYEIHVTVERVDDIEKFKSVCKELGVKPIVLDLNDKMIDVMTSSHHYGNNNSSLKEAKRISKGLCENGYNVLREKIETVPFHPAAPSDKDIDPKMPNNCYFESHIGCLVKNKSDKEIISKISDKFGAHLSRNFFKKNSDGSYVNMVTLRDYNDTIEKFQTKVENLKKEFDNNNIGYEKVIVEFSIYDTKISHDFLWLENQSTIV